MSTEKRMLLAVGLSVLVMFGFNHLGLFQPRESAQEAVSSSVSREVAADGTIVRTRQIAPDKAPEREPATTQVGDDSAALVSSAPQAEAGPAEPEELLNVVTDGLRVTATSRGGALKEIRLCGYGKDKDAGEDLFPYKEPRFLPLAISRLGADEKFWKRSFKIEQRDNAIFMIHDNGRGLVIEKQLVFGMENEKAYLVDAQVTFRNTSSAPITVAGGFDISAGYLFPLSTMRGADVNNVYLFGEDSKLTSKSAKKVAKDPVDSGRYIWAGIKNRYYCFILRPKDVFPGAKSAVVEDGDGLKGVASLVRIPEFSVPAGGHVTMPFSFFAGPMTYSLLADAGYRFTDILDFGWFSPVCILLLKMLLFFHGILRNYGLAIIVMTLLIKIVLFPLTHGSMKSMKKMQAVQPRVAELKEKYKDDAKKMQAEMMKIYKEEGINPLGGCLPMLMQLPIFIAFYSMLRNSIELQGASFLWISDLSAPDTVASIGAFPLNVLPLIMGVTTLVQQRMSTPPSGGNAQSQAMMKFMPLLFTFMFYSFPSGLVLYWLMNNVFTIGQQYITNKKA